MRSLISYDLPTKLKRYKNQPEQQQNYYLAPRHTNSAWGGPSEWPKQSTSRPVHQMIYREIEIYEELYKIAKIVLATPSSQVSVERMFSCLPLIVREKRTRIGVDLVRAIFLQRINKHLI